MPLFEFERLLKRKLHCYVEAESLSEALKKAEELPYDDPKMDVSNNWYHHRHEDTKDEINLIQQFYTNPKGESK